MNGMPKRLLAEAFGTFGLVLVGTGAIVVNDMSGGALGHLGVSLVFGLVVIVMIEAVGDVSGAHINPAVTLAFAVSRRLPWGDVLPYWIAQFAGAIGASALVRWMFGAHLTLGATLPTIPVPQAFAVEAVMTLILMYAVFAVSTGARERGTSAAATIGAVIAFVSLVAGPVTGSSLNPARSLGPALLSGTFDHLWLYMAAPTLGAVLAAPVFALTRGRGVLAGKVKT